MAAGLPLASAVAMKFFCRHCDQVITGKPYRVLSEEDGVVLLDMIVCQLCYQRAKDLGLRAEKLAFHRHSRQKREWGPATPHPA